MQEELFAPILPMLRWSDEDDVIARANATEMGLGASLWSRNVARARRIADQLESGSVCIYTHSDVSPKAPSGGHKSSGIGTERELNGLTAYCNSQTLWVKPGL